MTANLTALLGVDINPMYSLSGLLVGVLVGLTGVGGGSLMTPLLVLFFGVHPTTAVGTDLLYACITKIFGTAVHGKSNNVDWKIVGLMALGSVPAALITIWFINHNGKSEDFVRFMKLALGVVLLLTSVMVVMRKKIINFAHSQKELSQNKQMFLTFLTGATLGVLVSLTSVGAGAIGVTALILLYPKMPILKLVGTDIAHAVPLTFVAGLSYFMLGKVDVAMLISLLIGSIPGIIGGSWLAPKMPEKIIRYTLAVVLVLVGYKMLFPK